MNLIPMCLTSMRSLSLIENFSFGRPRPLKASSMLDLQKNETKESESYPYVSYKHAQFVLYRKFQFRSSSSSKSVEHARSSEKRD